MAGCRDLADIAMASGLLRFERPLVYLPSAFRRLHTRLRAPFVYTRFSQTSTGEKKVGRRRVPVWSGTAWSMHDGSANSHSVSLGFTNELALGLGACRDRQTAGF